MQISDEMVKAAVEAVSDEIDWVEALVGGGFDSAEQVMSTALEAALSATEPVKPVCYLVWKQFLRAADDVEDYYEVARPVDKCVDGSEPFPVYAAPPAPSVSVKALDFDTVYVIPREMTDEEWSEVKYNVDRKANPDIDLWRIKEAVKYANFIAGHRGRSALSAQVQDVAGWQPIETAPKDWTDIILYVPDEDDGTGSCGVMKGWYSMKDGGFNCWMSYEANSGQVYPTHWIPLPAAPAKQEGGE